MGGVTPLRIDEKRMVAMPFALLISLIFAATGLYSFAASTRDKVDRLEITVARLEGDQKIVRELLIRIDQNVSDWHSSHASIPSQITTTSR